VLSLQGQLEQALEDYRVLISAEPRLGDYFLAGNCAMELGSFAEANDCFRSLVEVAADSDAHEFDSAAYFLMAVCLREMGQKAAALACIDKASAIDPEIAMPVPGRDGVVSAGQLRQQLNSEG
jgi:tetratricopeptide (TPR) repeat protein